jgi:hypothetical protein
MPPKMAIALGASLALLDINHEGLPLREAWNQKRKAISPTPQEEELDQEIRDLEAIHQQVERRENMLRLSKFQKKSDEVAKEMCHITQDNEQGRRPQQRELHQESPSYDNVWYDDFNHGNFAFDDTSPLAVELQVTPWPPLDKPPQLPMYDGHSGPK